MRLEPELWAALDEICRRERLTLAEAVKTIEVRRAQIGEISGRTSAVRVLILDYFRGAATEEGHMRAGHGQCVELRA